MTCQLISQEAGKEVSGSGKLGSMSARIQSDIAFNIPPCMLGNTTDRTGWSPLDCIFLTDGRGLSYCTPLWALWESHHFCDCRMTKGTVDPCDCNAIYRMLLFENLTLIPSLINRNNIWSSFLTVKKKANVRISKGSPPHLWLDHTMAC